MNNIISLLFVYILISSTFTASSQEVKLKGKIFDTNTNKEIKNASISQNYTKNSTVSDNNGYFELLIKKTDTVVVRISCIGYKSLEIIPNINKNNLINIYLEKGDVKIEEIIISGKSKLPEFENYSELSVKQINEIPAIGGETDVLKAIQFLPGIQSTTEGSNNLIIRGGADNQNMILLNETPIYYLNHLGGFVSVINPNAVESIKLYKDGFPAKFGGKLSSVIKINTKNDSINNPFVKAKLGIASSDLAIEMPAKNNKTKIAVYARRLMFDLLMRTVIYTDDNPLITYTFYDINSIISHNFSSKSKLYINFYTGDDIFSFTNKKNNQFKTKAKWGNTLLSGKWLYNFNPKIKYEFNPAFTKYRHLNSQEYTFRYNNEYKKNISTSVNDFILNNKLYFLILENYKIIIGHNTIFHYFTPFNSSSTEGNDYVEKINTTENAIFIENKIEFNKIFSLNIGGRYTIYNVRNQNFNLLSPRFLFNYKINNNSSIKVTYMQVHQPIHLIDYTGFGIPVAIWLPATTKLPPEKSSQFSLNYTKLFYKEKIKLSFAGYYKKMENLTTFPYRFLLIGSKQDWEEASYTDGKGESYGIESYINAGLGKFSGQLSYTLSKTTRQFEGLNNAYVYPFKYDKRHNIQIWSAYNINDKVNIAASWTYQSGSAVTIPNQYYSIPEQFFGDESELFESTTVLGFSEKNSFRMKPFHKLDLSVNFKKTKKKTTRILNISIYNFYNRQNPYFYTAKETVQTNEIGHETGKTQIKLFQFSLFPVIPSVSYSIIFYK